jgi:predicted methyltransferase
MRAIWGLICAVAMLGLAGPAHAEEGADAALRRLVDGPQRSAGNRARDAARHPYELLHFFGLAKGQTVVEIWPGGSGYWTEILAPYLEGNGRYVAAITEPDPSNDEITHMNAAFAAKLKADPALYGSVVVTRFGGDRHAIAPDGTADLVVTFRNLHNWMARHEAEAAFRTFYKALKPGGVLGIEEHRGRTDIAQDPEARSGYVRQDYAIRLAEAAGFRLAGSSEVNANPKDTKDYPAGVWTLGPTFRLGQTDRARYAAIGESDRFVLKFVRPQ